MSVGFAQQASDDGSHDYFAAQQTASSYDAQFSPTQQDFSGQVAVAPAPRASTSSSSGSAASPTNTNPPAITPKPQSVLASPTTPLAEASQGPVGSQYTVPPRPKPGRKAATEQPDSKRKQQNREAQRAFRKRRSDKLDELDVKLQDQNGRMKELSTRNEQLNQTVKDLKAAGEKWEKRVLQAEQNAADLQSQLSNVQRELTFWKNRASEQQQQQQQNQQQMPAQAKPQPPVMGVGYGMTGIQSQYASPSGMIPPNTPPMDTTPIPLDHATMGGGHGVDEPMQGGCGDCEKTGNCACMDAMLNIPDAAPRPELRRDRSRESISIQDVVIQPQEQASAQHANIEESHYQELEQDFTNFGRPTGPSSKAAEGESKVSVRSAARVVVVDDDVTPSDAVAAVIAEPDPCGFCTNPSNCLCRPQEAKLIADRTRPSDMKGIDAAIMPPPKKKPTIKPGTCAQCMANPEQRKFCEGLARTRPFQPSSSDALDEPSSKRIRLAPIHIKDNVVPCSEAYAIFSSRQKQRSAGDTKILQSFYRDVVRTTPHVDAKAKDDKRYSAYDVELADCLLQLRGSNNAGEQ